MMMSESGLANRRKVLNLAMVTALGKLRGLKLRLKGARDNGVA